jgi:hypothetical protein
MTSPDIVRHVREMFRHTRFPRARHRWILYSKHVLVARLRKGPLFYRWRDEDREETARDAADPKFLAALRRGMTDRDVTRLLNDATDEMFRHGEVVEW